MPERSHNLYAQRTMPSELQRTSTYSIQREQGIRIICLKKTCNLQNCQVQISSEVICSFICLFTTEDYKPIIYKVKLHRHLKATIKLSHKSYLSQLGSRGWQRLCHAISVSLSAQQHQRLAASTFGGIALEIPAYGMDFKNQFLAAPLKAFIGRKVKCMPKTGP